MLYTKMQHFFHSNGSMHHIFDWRIYARLIGLLQIVDKKLSIRCCVDYSIKSTVHKTNLNFEDFGTNLSLICAAQSPNMLYTKMQHFFHSNGSMHHIFDWRIYARLIGLLQIVDKKLSIRCCVYYSIKSTVHKNTRRKI